MKVDACEKIGGKGCLYSLLAAYRALRWMLHHPSVVDGAWECLLRRAVGKTRGHRQAHSAEQLYLGQHHATRYDAEAGSDCSAALGFAHTG